MPEVTLTFPDEAQIPTELKAFKTADNKVKIWVNTDSSAMAAELNPALEANRNTILSEKQVIEDKYKALVATSGKNEVDAANLIANAEAKARNAISDDDKKIIEAVKKANPQITPEILETSIKEFPVLTEKLQAIEKSKESDLLFGASGFKNKTVFETVANNPALNPNLEKFILKDETVNGNSVKVAYAKVKEAIGGNTEVPMPEYAAANENWKPFAPALNNAPEQTNQWIPATQNTGFQAPNYTQGNDFLGAVIAGQAKLNAPKPKEETK